MKIHHDKSLQEIGKAIEVDVEPSTVSAIHRLGRKSSDRARSVIARFSNRTTQNKLLAQKKTLRDNQLIKGSPMFEDRVTVAEDLTEPRRKLMRDSKEMPGVEFAYV